MVLLVTELELGAIVVEIEIFPPEFSPLSVLPEEAAAPPPTAVGLMVVVVVLVLKLMFTPACIAETKFEMGLPEMLKTGVAVAGMAQNCGWLDSPAAAIVAAPAVGGIMKNVPLGNTGTSPCGAMGATGARLEELVTS